MKACLYGSGNQQEERDTSSCQRSTFARLGQKCDPHDDEVG
jgi:hypothetical protein